MKLRKEDATLGRDWEALKEIPIQDPVEGGTQGTNKVKQEGKSSSVGPESPVVQSSSNRKPNMTVPRSSAKWSKICWCCGQAVGNHLGKKFCPRYGGKCRFCKECNHKEEAHYITSEEAKEVLCQKWGEKFKFTLK